MIGDKAIKNTRALPYVGRLKALSPSDFVQTRMTVPASLVGRLHDIKRRHRIRTRDAVIGAMLRIARTQHKIADFQLPPEPPEYDPMQPITAEVQAEQLEFLYRLQRQFRGAALGAVFEAVASVVTDLAPPEQLELAGLIDGPATEAAGLSTHECRTPPSFVFSHGVSGGVAS